jgi:hypothetical protein
MAFGGEKIEELLADFTAFHNLHPSLIVATGGARSDFEPTGQGAHHTIQDAFRATTRRNTRNYLVTMESNFASLTEQKRASFVRNIQTTLQLEE